ncbi:MAG: bacteriochlorophyll 4-vinyl reductase [Gemmatimonadales bacterium]|nr:MAG: bacteriochlorophyll 4-vinyl reductase [Gemmatimonadales bacterium]
METHSGKGARLPPADDARRHGTRHRGEAVPHGGVSGEGGPLMTTPTHIGLRPQAESREASTPDGCTACGACGSACGSTGAPPEVARIGPNALIQTARALEALYGVAEARRLLRLGGMQTLSDHDPRDMQDERDFFRLVTFLEGVLPRREVAAVLGDAGRRTGAYVLANRIPGAARLGLRMLPRSLRLRLTLSAMAEHAWTFAGSGTFAFETRPHPTLRLAHGIPARTIPDPAPLHAFYRGAFEVLLRGMVAPGTVLEEGVPDRPPPRVGVAFRIRFDRSTSRVDPTRSRSLRISP